MSTAPNGYQTPKTNWAAGEDVPTASSFNRIEGNINAIEVGSRTLDQAQNPSGNSGSLRQILDWLVNRIKAISGKTNWYDSPDITLAAAKAHVDSASAHSATSSATANRMVLRDGSGRAQFAAPSSFGDAATKGYVDSLMTAANLRVVDRITSTTSVGGTNAETTLYSRNISGNTLASNGGLRLTIRGDHYCDGSPLSSTFRVKLGSTTIATFVTSMPHGTARHPWLLDCIIQNIATSSQRITTEFKSIPSTAVEVQMQHTVATEDTSTTRTLSVTVQHSTDYPYRETSLQHGILELILPT